MLGLTVLFALGMTVFSEAVTLQAWIKVTTSLLGYLTVLQVCDKMKDPKRV